MCWLAVESLGGIACHRTRCSVPSMVHAGNSPSLALARQYTILIIWVASWQGRVRKCWTLRVFATWGGTCALMSLSQRSDSRGEVPVCCSPNGVPNRLCSTLVHLRVWGLTRWV